MARHLIEVPFDPKKPLIVRKPFTAAGQYYRPGEVFDWRRQGIVSRRVELLYQQRKIVHEDSRTFPRAPDTVRAAPEIPPTERASDNLEQIDNMKVLRSIAEREGAPARRSKEAQREAIREHRD